ncbi:hypothetical protein TNCV_4537891 [Trichonephila clavipes]|nr:hypothetical protein TNCV_4537891 [Trichonephila clavipes]
MSFTRRPGLSNAFDRPFLEKTATLYEMHAYRPAASSAAIQAQVEPSLGPLCFSKPYERLAAKDIWDRGSPLRVMPLTPAQRCLRFEWCRARGNWTVAGMEPGRD